MPRTERDTIPRVDVVVLHWRNVELTLRCLASLAASRGVAARVIVVENGSGDGSVGPLRQWLRGAAGPVGGALVSSDGSIDVDPDADRSCGWWLVASARNLGYAGGMNAGLRLADALGASRYFWLVNNDLVVDPDALAHLVSRLDGDPGLALCGVRQLGLDDHGQPTGVTVATGGFGYRRAVGHTFHLAERDESEAAVARVERRMFGVQGAAVFGRWGLLRAGGFLDQDRFLYFEEVELARRARRLGYRLGYAPDAVVHHRVGAGVGNRDGRGGSRVSRYFMARSRVRFTRRCYPWALPTTLLYQFAIVLRHVCARRFGDARITLAGLCDGLTGRMRHFEELGDVAY